MVVNKSLIKAGHFLGENVWHGYAPDLHDKIGSENSDDWETNLP